MAKAKRKIRNTNSLNLIVNNNNNNNEYYGSGRDKIKPKRKYTQHDLVSFQPKTETQSEFFLNYCNLSKTVILQMGSAGTGKSAVALYASLHELFDSDTPYNKILIVRSAVQAREIGFLKGDEIEKNEVYEAPYKSLCDELLKYKSNNYINMKELGLIEFETTSFMRGKTFDNTIMIVDEIQNMTYEELSTIITRIGVYSRVILCGDFKQNDLYRKKNDQSGLNGFLKVLNNMDQDMVGIIEYSPEDIVRSGIAKEFLLAEERLS